jgi:two-component system, chemotaxis family, response regulator PixG
MLTPSSIPLVTPAIATYRIGSIVNLENWIQTCSQGQFTGRLDLEIRQTQPLQWSLFFHLGHLTGGASQDHPIRRWCRQLSQHCPQIAHSMLRGAQFQHWDYSTLVNLVKQGKISQGQMAAFVEGNLLEILFDLIQLRSQHRHSLEGQLTYRRIPEEVIASMSVSIQADRAWHQAKQAWNAWNEAGLGGWSPNLAPVILDAEELRRQVSLMTYHNLATLMDRDRTLRDLATQLKQHSLPLTLSILPHLHKGIIGLVEIKDSSYHLNPLTAVAAPIATATTVPQVQAKASGPLVAYIEDSRFDSLTMSQILTRAGYRFTSIQDPVQALPILLEQKPSLIFLDLLMPVTNGYEVCSQIRRTSAFRNIPIIIVTSSDGIVDRVRAKLAGTSGFIAKPIDPEKVLTTLRHHLPIQSSSRGSG